MSDELVALVGGPLSGKVVVNGWPGEPRLKFRTREIDDASYVMSVYGRGGMAADYQEYVYREDIVIHAQSLAAQGEDLWLLGLFPEGYRGYGADIGAYDGVATSNTLLLERKGWTVLCVEPLPESAGAATRERGVVEVCACGMEDRDQVDFHVHTECPGGYSSLAPTKDHPIWHPRPDAPFHIIQVRLRRLDTLLREHQFPRLDILSIDTEGTELDVLKGIDLDEWKPKAIISESWDAAGPVVGYLETRGYPLVERREPNNLYVRA